MPSVKFELNGQPQRIDESLDVRELLEHFDLHRRRVAVAINTEVIPKSRYREIQIQEGDRIEVIQAVGGG